MKIKTMIGICTSVFVAGLASLGIAEIVIEKKEQEKKEKWYAKREKEIAQERETYINTPIYLLKLMTQNNYQLPINNILPGGNRKAITILIIDTGDYDVERLYKILDNNEELKVIDDTETITIYKGFTHVSNIKRVYTDHIFDDHDAKIWCHEANLERLEKNNIKTDGTTIKLFRVTLIKESAEE